MATEDFRKLSEYPTKQERIDAVRRAMKAGHTNTSAAELLGTKLGVIAGIRNRSDIPSTHLPVAGPKRREATLPRQHGGVMTAGEDVPPLAGGGLQCEYMDEDRMQCGYRAEAEGRCRLHAIQKK